MFTCPLPYWRDRETHLVIRSGNEDLGQWITEARPVTADVRHALTPPYPERIVGIWLIANSTFQGGLGTCRYRDLNLHTNTATIPLATPPPDTATEPTRQKVL